MDAHMLSPSKLCRYLTPKCSCKRVNGSAPRSVAQSSDRLSAATFVGPQGEALAMRGPDFTPARRGRTAVRPREGEPSSAELLSPCERPALPRRVILRYLQKCSPDVESLGQIE